MNHFYNNKNRDNYESLRSVADLVDEFLAEIAADIDLKTTTFVEVANLSIAVAEGANENRCGGIYRPLDVFLEKHKHLTRSEKEDLCGKVLDCSKLSREALQHAALNRRLPLRVVVKALQIIPSPPMLHHRQIPVPPEISRELRQTAGEIRLSRLSRS